MSDFWTEELTPEETEKLIRKVADEIIRRKMQTPAILALDMHKPLANVTSSAGVVFAPFLVPFLGFHAVNDYTRLLAKQENVERLIAMIDESRDVKEDPCTKAS